MKVAGWRRILALLGAAMMLAAVVSGCGTTVPPLPKLEADEVIVAFGDSLTYGTGARDEESYPEVLAGLIGHRVVRAGVPGEVTAQGLERLPAVLEEYKPRILLLCLGGNDMLRKKEEREIVDNLRAMIKLARDQGVAVVLIGVPRPALLGGTAEFYEGIAEEFEIPFEGKIIKEVLYSSDTKSDPIHPNAKGYRLIAEKIAELLKEAGAV